MNKRALSLANQVFFDAVRKPLFGGKLSQLQVANISLLIMTAPANAMLEDIAYVLATARWEVGVDMEPVRERGSRSYFDRYEAGTAKGRELGNTMKGDGFKYRGGGYPQVTGRSNYAKASAVVGVDLVASPERILEPHIAAEVTWDAMTKGWFTGKKLRDYIKPGGSDFFHARKIVNGLDKAETIAGYASVFLRALQDAEKEARRLSIIGKGPKLDDGSEPVAVADVPAGEEQGPATKKRTGFGKWLTAALSSGGVGYGASELFSAEAATAAVIVGAFVLLVVGGFIAMGHDKREKLWTKVVG